MAGARYEEKSNPLSGITIASYRCSHDGDGDIPGRGDRSFQQGHKYLSGVYWHWLVGKEDAFK
jgi:hypothetical protein